MRTVVTLFKDQPTVLMCPKCNKISGDAWDCFGGCPVQASPHFSQIALEAYGPLVEITYEKWLDQYANTRFRD